MEWLETVEPRWFWLSAGMILAIAEMVIPGVFLIWLAGAAVLTGLIAWLVPLGFPLQIVLFAVLAIVSVFVGKRYLAANPVTSADPLLNDRGGQLVGETVVVAKALVAGEGRVRHGDSEWLAKGPDAEAGTRMRVAGHSGTVLLVEHLH